MPDYDPELGNPYDWQGETPKDVRPQAAETAKKLYDVAPTIAYESLPPVVAKRAYEAVRDMGKEDRGWGEWANLGLTALDAPVPGPSVAPWLKAMFLAPATLKKAGKAIEGKTAGTLESLEEAQEIWRKAGPDAGPQELNELTWNDLGWARGDTYGQTHGPMQFGTNRHYSYGKDFEEPGQPFTWMTGTYPTLKPELVDDGIVQYQGTMGGAFDSGAFDAIPELRDTPLNMTAGPGIAPSGLYTPSQYGGDIKIEAGDIPGAESIGFHEMIHDAQNKQNIVSLRQPEQNIRMVPAKSQSMRLQEAKLKHYLESVLGGQRPAPGDQTVSFYNRELQNAAEDAKYYASPWELMAREGPLRARELGDDLDLHRARIPFRDFNLYAPEANYPMPSAEGLPFTELLRDRQGNFVDQPEFDDVMLEMLGLKG